MFSSAEWHSAKTKKGNRMGNPEKGPGKLGHEGKGNEPPKKPRNDRGIQKELGKAAIKGSKGK